MCTQICWIMCKLKYQIVVSLGTWTDGRWKLPCQIPFLFSPDLTTFPQHTVNRRGFWSHRHYLLQINLTLNLAVSSPVCLTTCQYCKEKLDIDDCVAYPTDHRNCPDAKRTTKLCSIIFNLSRLQTKLYIQAEELNNRHAVKTPVSPEEGEWRLFNSRS